MNVRTTITTIEKRAKNYLQKELWEIERNTPYPEEEFLGSFFFQFDNQKIVFKE